MAGETGRRRFVRPRWTGELATWVDRRAERSADNDEERLSLAEKRLAKCVEKEGPGSPRTINAMEAVAKCREGLGHYDDARPLREQVLALRRRNLGKEHPLSLAAEARLAVTLIGIQRPDLAKPMLEHVRRGLTAAHGRDDVTVLAVSERLADTQLALDETADARSLLEDVRQRYEQRGDELPAAGVAVKLAKALVLEGQYPEASELLRSVVTVRSRLLGPDDSETLTSLRNLATALVWEREYAEASIVARNLLARSYRTLGPEHSHTLDAERLVDDIGRRMASG
jgi:tetratricopeptide (TPR) repeat protein